MSLISNRGMNAQPTVWAIGPSVSAELTGPPESVSDDRSACEPMDIPDAYPRAFRDFNNIVHLIATHYIGRGMVGPNLNSLRHSCDLLFHSAEDPDPAHFLDKSWLTSLYTADGRNISALMHTEYQGETHPGMCPDIKDPNRFMDCTFTAITYAESHDGGHSFHEPAPPNNLVASLPYRYDNENRAGMQGYESPTNILKLGKFYYSMINVWREYKSQKYGPCLVRTPDLTDPSSWRGYDGKGFTVRFINPYTDKNANPAQHVCSPIFPGSLDSLSIDEKTGVIVGIVYSADNRYGMGTGLYVMGSRDLIHWSRPKLVASTDDMLKAQTTPGGGFAYDAILDPESRDRNFTTISSTPYVYYVRLGGAQEPHGRVLYRRRMKISIAR